MFVDTRNVSEGSSIDAAVCIIGAGAAGITLALELEKHGIETCVLESGGFEPDERTMDLYRGENGGVPYTFADDCRSRYLGGSSNCWGGWCRPLDEWDFEKRSWVADSGWPISREDLMPYYLRAMGILKLGPNNFDPAHWEAAINRSDVRRIPLVTGKMVDTISQFSPPVRFGLDYHNELKRAKHVRVFLHGNVVDIEADKSVQNVQRVQVKTLTGKTMWVRARLFVLACGGIENARILLACNRQQPAGLGNAHDIVGRYFADHPRLMFGSIKFSEGWARNKLYDAKFHYQNPIVGANGTCISSQFMLKKEVQESEQLLNSRVWFCSMFPGEGTEATQALIRMKMRMLRKDEAGHKLSSDMLAIMRHPWDAARFAAARVFHPRTLITDVKMQAIVEPSPDRESRIVLSQNRDALGMPRVRVVWRLSDQVKRTFDRTYQILAEELTRQGIGQVRMDAPILGREWPGVLEGTWHHMGSTRMHESPKHGVVDKDCRIHGLNNFYIAGSSVFPTVGANFPTITLVALALRLSGRLVADLDAPVADLQSESRIPA